MVHAQTVRAQEVTIKASVDRARLYEGESLIYTLNVSNVEDLPPPELPVHDFFDVHFLGPQSYNTSSFSITPGGRSSVRRFGIIFRYRLTPRSTGEMEIPPPVVNVNGEEIAGRRITVQVLEPGAQEVALLEIEAVPAIVYPTQKCEVLLTVALKGLPAPYESRSPLEPLIREHPSLEIPWAIDENLPEKLQPEQDWKTWLGSYVYRGNHGFAINDIRRDDSLFLFFDSQRLLFQPQPERVTRTRADGEEDQYWEYTFTRTFHSNHVGEYGLGRAILRGTFAGGEIENQKVVAERVFATTPEVTITVREPPEEGRPESYIGAIGMMECEAQVTPEEVRVGDPLTLTLNLRSEGSLALAVPPDLEQIPEFAEQFRIYDASTDTQGGTRRFVYALRSKTATVDAIPSIPLSYFDVETERYVTLETERLPVDVAEAERLSAADLAKAPRDRTDENAAWETSEEGLFGKAVDISALRNQRIRPLRWAAGMGGLCGAYLAAWGVVAWRRRPRNEAEIRRRGAWKRSQNGLREARQSWERKEVRAAAEKLHQAVSGYVADTLGGDDPLLSGQDLAERLELAGLPDELVERAARIAAASEEVRFGSSSNLSVETFDDAKRLLADLASVMNMRSF